MMLGATQVDIVDVSLGTFDYEAIVSSLRYDPPVDLNGNGMIEIIGMIRADYTAPICKHSKSRTGCAQPVEITGEKTLA